jgi:hypothetical protein
VSAAWRIEDDVVGVRETSLAPGGGTVSLAFIRGTLRRLWYVWVGSTLVGAALAAGWLTLVPPHSVGSVTLLLAHDPGTDADAAMATDVRLLRTRTVAQQLADRLGVDVSPDDLQDTIVAQAATSSVLQVDITGTDQDDAVRRARLLADTYLAYRQEQLTEQSDDVTQAYRDRVDALQTQVDGLTKQYDAITARGGSEAETADVLGLRGQLISEITRLQNDIETETLEANAVVAASRVLDDASLEPQSPLRRAALVLASGLIGGLGLGLGLVVVYAITTGRLRSRADVAAAMGVPVMFSAGELVPRWGRPGPRHQAALDLLVDGLETAIPNRGKRPHRLGLISVDCGQDGARVLAGLARRLGTQGTVLVVDTAGTGGLAEELESPTSPTAAGPTGSVAVVEGPTVNAVADEVLTLVPFEMGRGLGHVKVDVSRCVVLVRAGRSTAEQLSTVARSARTARLDVQFVMLVGADESDASFGGGVAVEKAPPAR